MNKKGFASNNLSAPNKTNLNTTQDIPNITNNKSSNADQSKELIFIKNNTPNSSSAQTKDISGPHLPQTNQNGQPSQSPIVISFATKNKKDIIIQKGQNQQRNINISDYKPSPKPPNTIQFKFSPEELKNQKIADENRQIVESNKFHITESETIDEDEHIQIKKRLIEKVANHQNTSIIVKKMSTIEATIEIHSNLKEDEKQTKKICVLNFANPFKPGGGYLNGRMAQEEALCRQTLLYPTLEHSRMYEFNKSDQMNSIEYDTMIYSPDVHVIRDDRYSILNDNIFRINVISAPAVDNRKDILDLSKAELVMERRIRKIISLAIDKKNDFIVLGAFGCGVFRNDPKIVSRVFKKVLVDENLKDYFESVVFAIYKNDENFNEFENTFIE